MKIRIIGMGALGIMYADYIQRHKRDEDSVAFVMDKERISRHQGEVFTCNGRTEGFQMEDCEEASWADLVMVAVKFGGLRPAVEMMKNCIGEQTIVMSVMNGISSEDIIAETYGSDRMIYTVAQGMDAMKSGSCLKYTQMGELRIGAKEESQRDNVRKIAAYFDAIALPYKVDEDIMHRIWGKFMLNVGVNQACMAYGVTYKGVLKPGEAHDVMLAAMQEVLKAGNAEGVSLTEEDISYYVGLLETLDPEGYPSMAQDRVAGRPSEVEMFAGTVIPICKRHGIEASANEKLYQMVKDIEAQY